MNRQTLAGTPAVLRGILLVLLIFSSFAQAGSLSGSQGTAARTVNLTVEGSADWIHWGRTSSATVDRKSGVAPRFSNYTVLGSRTPAADISASSSYSWSDGFPATSFSNDKHGVRISGATGAGFRFVAAADSTLRTVRIYVGANRARARLTARLSDGSAAAYATVIDLRKDRQTRLVTLSYRADSADQTLSIEYVLETAYSGSHSITLEAAAMQGSGAASATVATPSVSPSGGTWADSVQVSLATSTSGADIYYTTNGATPTSASARYAGPFTLTASTTVKAVGVRLGYNNSSIASAAFIVEPTPTVATPTITPNGGTFADAVAVSLATATSGASIYYTTNGATPTTASTPYSGPFTLTQSATVKAVAVRSGYNNSATASAAFTVEPTPTVATPTITPNGGTFPDSVQVSLATATSGASIYFTTNGATPTTASTPYSGPFTLTQSATVKAVAVRSGYNDSAVTSAAFTVQTTLTVATPTITPNGGTFSSAVQVSLATTTAGAAIRYTLDGTTPTSSSALYTSPFTLTASATVRAVGLLSGYNASGVASAVFDVASLLPYINDFSSGSAMGWQVVNDAGVTPAWSVVSGEYRQTTPADYTWMSGGAMQGGYHRGTYAYWTGGTTLTDYRLTVDATALLESAQDVGVMVRLNTGTGDYIRFSMSGAHGFARLESRVGSAFTTLAKNARGLRTGVTNTLSLEVKGPLVIARLNGVRLFAAYEPNVTSGAPALYCRDACAFDNVRIEPVGTTPAIAIVAPVAYSTTSSGAFTARAVVLNRPAGATVAFDVNGSPCAASVEQGATGYYSAACATPGTGVYQVGATLRNSGGVLLDSQFNASVGNGDNFAALGDSITQGMDDNTASDGISNGGWIISSTGYRALLTDRLNASQPYPTIVHGASAPGDTSANLANDRLASRLEQFVDANRATVMIGVNDTNGTLFTPSGLGCSGTACAGTYKGNLQAVIDQLNAAGKVPMVNRVPPRFGNPGQTPYASPQTESRNVLIRDGYNAVIANELTGRLLGPDLYDYFVGSENRFYLYVTNLHPNALGQAIIAQLMHNALTGSNTAPFIVTNLCLKRTESATSCVAQSTRPYKQNLLEVGDTYHVDATLTLTGTIPAALANGRWIMTTNADRDLANSNYLAFNVPLLSTVYVAYDASAPTRPAWLANNYSDSGLTLTTSNASAPVLRLYRRLNVSGNVVMGGAAAAGNGAGSNYIVVVVQN